MARGDAGLARREYRLTTQLAPLTVEIAIRGVAEVAEVAEPWPDLPDLTAALEETLET